MDCRSPSSLEDAVQLLLKEQPVVDVLEIDVRRKLVLQDAIREGKKKKFFHTNYLKSVETIQTGFSGQFCW